MYYCRYALWISNEKYYVEEQTLHHQASGNFPQQILRSNWCTTQIHPNHHGVLFAQIGSKLSNYPTSLFSDHLWYILTLREFHLPHLPLLEKKIFPFQDFAPLFRWKASQSPKDRKPSETAWGWATAVPCMGILVVNRNRVQKHKEFWSTRRSGAPKRKKKHVFVGLKL